MTREEIEKALDEGRLWMQVRGGRWWICRRNGKTRTWKRTVFRFEIPIKAGLKVTGRIGHTSGIGRWPEECGFPCKEAMFMICEFDPGFIRETEFETRVALAARRR